jgi:hypothetical protein
METISAFLTPVLAITTGTILVLQYLLAGRQWRLSLYDKRYPVYLRTMEYLSHIGQRAGLKQDELMKFLRDSRDKEFLFKKDVQEHLGQLYSKGVALMTLGTMLEGDVPGDKRSELVDKQSKLLEWFSGQFEISKELFGEYLRIDKK